MENVGRTSFYKGGYYYFCHSKILTELILQPTGVLAIVWLECVTNEKNESSFQCCIKDEGRPLIYAFAGGVYKPLHGAVIKSYGTER